MQKSCLPCFECREKKLWKYFNNIIISSVFPIWRNMKITRRKDNLVKSEGNDSAEMQMFILYIFIFVDFYFMSRSTISSTQHSIKFHIWRAILLTFNWRHHHLHAFPFEVHISRPCVALCTFFRVFVCAPNTHIECVGVDLFRLSYAVFFCT